MLGGDYIVINMHDKNLFLLTNYAPKAPFRYKKICALLTQNICCHYNHSAANHMVNKDNATNQYYFLVCNYD